MARTSLLFLVIIAFVVCAHAAAFAVTLQEITSDLEQHIEPGSVLGIGIMYPERPYKGVDTDAYPVPVAMLQYKRFFIDGTLFGFHLVTTDTLTFSVAASPRFEGYSADDSPDLAGMQEREWGFDAGVRAQMKKGNFSISIAGLADVTGTHEGQELLATASVALFEGVFKPRVGARWLSEETVDYYYGVRPFEATPTRPSYEPDAVLDCVVGARVAIPIGKQWAAILDAQYEFLGRQIEDSPIVDEEGLARVVAGVVYRF